MTVHRFTSTREVWTRLQSGDLHDGDLLLIPSENVAGWLEQVWPIAATTNVGCIHDIADGAAIVANHPDRDQAYIETKVRAALAALAEISPLPVAS